jgi:acetate kinase
VSGLVLTLNAGSSSIKFGLYDAAPEPAERLRGQIDRLGEAEARLVVGNEETSVAAPDHATGLRAILAALEPGRGTAPIRAVGHRVVHGGPEIDGPRVLDDAAVDTLEALSPLAPLHQPHNLAGIRAAMAAFPEAVQIACFDTAFHRGHPWVNDTFALPRRFYDAGVRRYGFHGLSYEFISSELARIAPELHAGRVAVAHLGNGASMCGIVAGSSVASSMGFTALDGLPMGTRCGQLDPGVVLYLMQEEGMDDAAISELLYRKSGLLGLSGISNDMRRLEESEDPKADEAIDYFTFRIRRELGGLAAAMEGLDAVVFTGGIGEHSARVRREVCAPMRWLGIELDEEANARHGQVISADGSRVTVMVVPTNEELVIARAAAAELEDGP